MRSEMRLSELAYDRVLSKKMVILIKVAELKQIPIEHVWYMTSAPFLVAAVVQHPFFIYSMY